MKSAPGRSGLREGERREQFIAALLWYGTWLASALIAAGLLLIAIERPFLFQPSGTGLARAGIIGFILLPIARLLLMLVIFLYERDHAYAMIVALVLAIIGAAGLGFAM
ncbi:MAG TPA: DUF1634 domain-containing protein [Paracoccaceae bacterium]|nr:DUF1634 domain-containing protein [Paracoccaceae bacterium]